MHEFATFLMPATGADFLGVLTCFPPERFFKIIIMKDVVTMNLIYECDRILNEVTTGISTFKNLKIGLLKFYP